MEVQAPGIVGRQPVTEPLQTGIKAIDAMTPIGRGQRELIIGDRKTGKTTVAIDTIINQDGQGVKCIYVAIGQKNSSVAQTVATLEEHGARVHGRRRRLGRRPRPVQVPGPLRRLRHGPALDGERRARAHRLRRPLQAGRGLPPSRCCCAARRAARRTPATSSTCTPGCSSAPPSSPTRSGGGSLTALPIIETKAGDISAYIPTNVISITDGQVFLETDLFNSGVRPAINVGNSVSRVGGAAQVKAMKAVSGTLKIDLAQFRDLEAFATFGSELDKVSQAQLDRGYRLTELLKQPLNEPVPVEEQVVVIYAGTKGWIDTVPVTEVRRFETELLAYFRANHPAVLDDDPHTGALPDGDELDKGADHLPRRLRHREGRLSHGRRPGARAAAADPQRPVDEEDHQGDGAHRRVADRARPGADRGQPPLPRGHGARSCA